MASGTIGVFATTDVTPDDSTPTRGLVADAVKSLPGNSYNSQRGATSMPNPRGGEGPEGGRCDRLRGGDGDATPRAGSLGVVVRPRRGPGAGPRRRGRPGTGPVPGPRLGLEGPLRGGMEGALPGGLRLGRGAPRRGV